MPVNIGIVGLPNVGKSTLFNALSSGNAEAANFPFCTIEPNVGIVAVPDPRLGALAKVYSSEKTLPAHLEFVDIAGLVAGASKGEGLGNTFLGHIRDVDAIAHVVRCFDDDNVTHVAGKVDPAADVATIETELILKDLESVEKRRDKTAKNRKTAGKAGQEAQKEWALLDRLYTHLEEGAPARTLSLNEDESVLIAGMGLLSQKPTLFIGNVNEDDVQDPNNLPHVKTLQSLAEARNAPWMTLCAAVEAEISQLAADDQLEFLQALGLEEPGLSCVIRNSFTLLGLHTYLTAGPKETRAWTIPIGARAPQAAGVIHSDFERGFIRAEVSHWQDLVSLGSESAVRSQGKLRVEGKDYTVQDGDVIHFRFNV